MPRETELRSTTVSGSARAPSPARFRSAAAVLFLAAFSAVAVWQGLRFARRFPGSYVWTEDMISYAGGFVRRGLLGEIAWRLDPLVPAPGLVGGAYVALYILAAAWFTRETLRRPSLGAVLLLLSPVGILYPLLMSEAFGRKDAFIVAAFVLALEVARRRPRHAAAGLVALFVPAGLVTETAWFYLPLATVAARRLAAGGGARGGAGFWLPPALAGALALAVTLAWGVASHGTAGAITAAWRLRYPGAFADPGALVFLDWPLIHGILLMVLNQRTGVGVGYLAGFALACLPLAVLALEGKPYPAQGSRRHRLAVAGAVLCLFVPFLLGSDWGRFTHLIVLTAGAALLATRGAADAPAPSGGPAVRLALAALVLLYATTWRLSHWSNGTNPLRPGPIFQLTSLTAHAR